MKVVLEEKDINQAIVIYLEEKGLNPVVGSVTIDHDGLEYFADVLIKE